MSWEIPTFIVAVIAAGAAIVYGEVQRRAAQKQRRFLVQLQLRLAQQQAEARPHIKVSWATPKIKYESHLLEQAKLRVQIQNTGKVAARGVTLLSILTRIIWNPYQTLAGRWEPYIRRPPQSPLQERSLCL